MDYMDITPEYIISQIGVLPLEDIERLIEDYGCACANSADPSYPG